MTFASSFNGDAGDALCCRSRGFKASPDVGEKKDHEPQKTDTESLDYFVLCIAGRERGGGHKLSLTVTDLQFLSKGKKSSVITP